MTPPLPLDGSQTEEAWASGQIEDNDVLLKRALLSLTETGSIEYTGEFGAEITTFIPFAFWLKRTGQLDGRRVVTYGGMRPYYYFLDEGEYAEKTDRRRWLAASERRWPTPSTYTAVKSPWHAYPDYRRVYRDGGPAFDRPVLFIQNKFCMEWDIGPLNFLPLNVLDRLFAMLSKQFAIVYSRPKIETRLPGYTGDLNFDCDYPDRHVLRQHPGVMVLEDHCIQHDLPYNLTKLQILAKSHLMVGVQGGGSHLLACFGDSLFLLYHRAGAEDPHAYAQGPYKYLASPAPTLLVARTMQQLGQALALFSHVKPDGAGFSLDRSAQPIIEALRT